MAISRPTLHRPVLLLSLLFALSAPAEEMASPQRWGLLVSAGVGGFGEPPFDNDVHMGWLVAAHVMVTTPFGLELGPVFQRGASFKTAVGNTVDDLSGPPSERARDGFWGLGVEARYRFLRDARISPWLGVRLGWSHSTKLDTDGGFNGPYFYSGSSMAAALGGGVDLRVQGRFGLVLSSYFQSCDVDYRPADVICKGQPALMSLLVSPRLRF